MMIRNQMKDPNALMRMGLVFLILGNISRYFLHPMAHFGQGVVDGTLGLLFGISFGCLLLSVRWSARRC